MLHFSGGVRTGNTGERVEQRGRPVRGDGARGLKRRHQVKRDEASRGGGISIGRRDDVANVTSGVFSLIQI